MNKNSNKLKPFEKNENCHNGGHSRPKWAAIFTKKCLSNFTRDIYMAFRWYMNFIKIPKSPNTPPPYGLKLDNEFLHVFFA